MKLRLGALAPMVVALAATAEADETDVFNSYTAETMYRLCEKEEPDVPPVIQSYICTFRLQGLISVMTENCASVDLAYEPVPALFASRPPSMRSLKQAYKNYMEENPADWGLPWHFVAARAAADNFPCPTEAP